MPRPAEALEIYRQRVVPTLNQANGKAYAEAARFLKKIRGLMQRLEREEEFAKLIGNLRAGQKRKRNFIALLDNMGW